jgi:hypothetical protein
MQPKEFMVVEKNRKFPQKEVPRKMAEMVPKEGAEIQRHSVAQCIKGACRKFQTICTTGGKGAKLVNDPRSHENIVLEEAVHTLGLETKRHPTPCRLE